MYRALLACFVAITCVAMAWGQAPASTAKPAAPAVPASNDDPWLKSRYQLRLVFAFEKHPALTNEFMDHVRNAVLSAVTLDLGGICDVEVLTEHPYLADVTVKGLGELDKKQAILDDAKTHFIRVSYDNGQYEIQVRQMDGATGITSPMRKLSTPDRIWVSRAIGLSIARDFGIVGMVTNVIDETVDVKLRGNGQNDPESVRVQPGDVFAISRIQGKPPKAQGSKMPNALLVVTSALNGNGCTTRFYGERNSKLQPKKETYRIIKLGTLTGPLNLQVVDAASRNPLIAGVKTSQGSFGGTRVEELSTNNQGRVRGQQLYKNMVLIELTLAGQTMRMPLAIVDDQPIIIALAGTKALEDQEAFNYRLKVLWKRMLNESAIALRAEIGAIHELNKKSEGEAVARAEQALKKFQEDDAVALQRELNSIKEELAGTVPNGAAAIAAAQKALDEHVKAATEYLKEFIGERTNPTPAQKLKRNGRMAEQAADYAEAIKNYKESLQADGNQPELKARVDKLEKAMQSKGPKHDQAKKFVTEVWGTLQADDLQKRMKEATDAVRELKTAGDFPTALRMVVLNTEHMVKLSSLYNALKGVDDDEAEAKRKVLQDAFNGIEKLNDDIEAFVRTAGG